MTSSDNFITIELFNNGIHEIKSEMKQMKNEFHQEIQDTKKELLNEIRVNSIKIEGVHNSVNWGFAVATITITAVIAIIGLIATLAPTIKEFFTSKQKKFTTEEKVQSMIETAITNALAGKLR